MTKSLKVRQNNQSCLLRWRYVDQHYSLTWGRWDNPSDKAKLDLCGKIISQDCLADNFDFSLDKYRCWLLGIVPPTQPSTNIKFPLLDLLKKRIEENYNAADQSLLKLLESYSLPIRNQAEAKKFIKWIENRNVKSTTTKRYLAILQVIRKDLFEGIKIKVAERPKPKPFTKEEIDSILTALRESPLYHSYSDFVLFLFNTGVRTSEAIGIRWQDADLIKKEIHIFETLSRNRGSTANRIRKSTKTSKYRIVPMNETVHQMLSARIRKGELIFLSPKGKVIDDHTFSQRGWKFALQALGIEHRNLYRTRATFASHCAASGMPAHEIAALLGHSKVDTLYNYYLGQVKKPILPEL